MNTRTDKRYATRSEQSRLSFVFALLLCLPLACDTGLEDTLDSSGTEYVGTTSAAQTANTTPHGDTDDCDWDSSNAVAITLNGSTISANDAGVDVFGRTATIVAEGTYLLSGTLSNGQIIVDAGDDALVQLVLDDADIRCSTNAPIYVKSADLAVIILEDGTSNYLQDGSSYTLADASSDEPNAALFSASDLTLCGSGSLTIDARYNDAIAGKDGLVIYDGKMILNAVDDGIRGKDYLCIYDGDLTINADGDGLKSDNDEDAGKGYIRIDGGSVDVTAEGDGITAQTDVLIAGGTVDVESGGGSLATISSSLSAKGIKGLVSIIISGGTLSVDSADDAIHSNNTITINGGTFTIASGDDGVHADDDLIVNGGTIDITRCYEGLESGSAITINDGEISVVASDDGLNVAGGVDGSGMGGAFPGGGGYSDSGDYHMYINGGRIVVNARGDGIDCNGPVDMTGGIVIVDGPIANDNGALDYTNYFKITGGYLLATGSAGMAQAPSSTSTQRSVKITFSSSKSANTIVRLQRQGTDIFTFAPSKTYRSAVFSYSTLQAGYSYNVYTGGSCTGTKTDGLYEGGTYTPGTLGATFTISGTVTNVTAY